MKIEDIQKPLQTERLIFDEDIKEDILVTQNIEIVPRDSQWLLSAERSWKEIDAVIEGQLQGVEQNLLDDNDNAYKRRYNSQEVMTIPEARAVAYKLLLDEHEWAKKAKQAKLEKLNLDYEVEKKLINKEEVKKKVKDEGVRRLYKGKYEPEINRVSAELASEKKLEQQILKKVVLEIFGTGSQGKLSIEAMPKLLEGENASEITSLTTMLSDYLVSIEDRGLFHSYQYRQNKDLVQNRQDTKTLSNALEFVLDVNKFSEIDEVQEQLSNLGKAYFIFLRNRAISLHPGIQEKYPRMSLIYDTLSAAFSSGNSSAIRTIGKGVVDEYFGELLKSNNFRQEVNLFMNNLNTLGELLKSRELNGFFVGDQAAHQVLYEQPELPMFFAFHRLVTYSKQFYEMKLFDKFDSVNKIYTSLREKFPKDYSKFLILDGEDATIKKEKLLYILPSYGSYLDRGCTEMLYYYLKQHSYRFFDGGIVPRKHPHSEKSIPIEVPLRINKVLSETDGTSESRERYAFSLYLVGYWEGERNKIKTVEKQNHMLRSEVTDNSKWFVSPRGDRFADQKDEELSARGVESITFGINKSFPREHVVQIKFTNVHQNFSFWMNKEGRLVDKNHKPFTTDIVYTEIFSNLILKRLYAITSGKFSEGKETELIESDLEKGPFEWRRAFYRKFKPGGYKRTDSHKEAILTDYGINLDDEIERRRKIGTLEANQSMTFVREIAPRDAEGYLLTSPNELSFNPDWIPKAL